MWLPRLERENASLLSRGACPWNLATMLWGSPSHPHEEDLKSLAHSPSWYFSCQPEAACRSWKRGDTEVHSPVANWWSRKEQRWAIPTGSCPHFRFMRKINDCWCFKPLSLGMVCYAVRANQNEVSSQHIPQDTWLPAVLLQNASECKRLWNWHKQAMIYFREFKESI